MCRFDDGECPVMKLKSNGVGQLIKLWLMVKVARSARIRPNRCPPPAEVAQRPERN